MSARDYQWAVSIARWLALHEIRPNTISVMSVVFAVFAAACLVYLGQAQYLAARILLPISAAVFIFLRMLCNLFDGMVAIEQQRRTKSGEIFNELPDRFADAFILAGAGYVSPEPTWLVELGWMAAILAVITAYVRALGASAGTGQYFIGPMAKPQRMAIMTMVCVALSVTPRWSHQPLMVVSALGIISVGCLITIARRAIRIINELESR